VSYTLIPAKKFRGTLLLTQNSGNGGLWLPQIETHSVSAAARCMLRTLKHLLMQGIKRTVDDAYFLWTYGKKESAFLLVLIAVAAVSKLRYPQLRDGNAFRQTLVDFQPVRLQVEYRGELQTIEHIFYKWVRCHLVHESELPADIEFQGDDSNGSMSVRAGGQPDYLLQIGTGWFFHFVQSVLKSTEMAGSR